VSRPTKLNDDLQKKIVDCVKAGNYIETASALAGINKSTLYDWLKRGEREKQRVAKNNRYRVRKDEKKFVKFSNAIQKALAESEVRDLTNITRASERNWQASAWKLERKFPDRWGKKTSHEVTGKDGGAIEIEDARRKLIDKFASKLEEE